MAARRLLLAVLLSACAARLALAHGTAVELSAVGGKLAADKTHYVSESKFQAGSFLQGDLPGYSIVSSDRGIPIGAAVSLQGVGKLWHWSPSSRGVADTAAVLALSNPTGDVLEISGLGAPEQPLLIAPYLGEAPWHWHLDYFLAPLDASPGAYAALLSPRATELAPGEPFLLIFGLYGQQFNAADLPEAVDDLVAAALGSKPRLPGDANLDSRVDLLDFGLLKANFGQSPAAWSQGDFDGNLAVDLSDFGVLKANFGATAAAVPEPATWVLGTSGLLVWASWRSAARRRTARIRYC